MKQCYLYRIKYCSGKILYSFKTFSRTEVIITHTERDRQTDTHTFEGLPRHNDKESVCQCRRWKRLRFNPWARKILWSRKWQPSSSLLAREIHGQRSPAGYSPWGCKESHRTEQTHTTHTHTHTHTPESPSTSSNTLEILALAHLSSSHSGLISASGWSCSFFPPFLPAFFPPTHTWLSFFK